MRVLGPRFCGLEALLLPWAYPMAEAERLALFRPGVTP